MHQRAIHGSCIVLLILTEFLIVTYGWYIYISILKNYCWIYYKDDKWRHYLLLPILSMLLVFNLLNIPNHVTDCISLFALATRKLRSKWTKKVWCAFCLSTSLGLIFSLSLFSGSCKIPSLVCFHFVAQYMFVNGIKHFLEWAQW